MYAYTGEHKTNETCAYVLIQRVAFQLTSNAHVERNILTCTYLGFHTSESSSRRRLPAMLERLLIKFTCLVTLDCKLVKSKCSVTKRFMSSKESTC